MSEDFAERRQQYIEAMYEAIAPGDWAAIVAQVVAEAQGGSAKARRLLQRWLTPQGAEIVLRVVTDPTAQIKIEVKEHEQEQRQD